MLTRRHPVLALVLLCALGGAWTVAACDLNPQPLPPGATGSFGSGNDAGGVATTPTAGVDAGEPAAGPGDAGGPIPPPAGDAGAGGSDADASSGLDDGGAKDAGALDGAADAPTDAPADAPEEGG